MQANKLKAAATTRSCPSARVRQTRVKVSAIAQPTGGMSSSSSWPRVTHRIASAQQLYEQTGQLQLLHKTYQYGLSREQLRFDSGMAAHESAPHSWPTWPKYQAVIGNTPLVDLSCLSANPKVKILGKCEFTNPSNSIKDRIAQYIIDEAERSGKLRRGGTVVAATSGNTGSAVGMICAMRNYNYIVITNEKTSKEKIDSMAAYGGRVIVAPSGVPADHPQHYQNLATTLCSENPNYFDVNQYDNPNNPEAYYRSLGPEIWQQTYGTITHFVAGGSTGGTISGTGRFLKEQNPGVKVVMPDPVGSVFWDYYVNGTQESQLKPKSYQVEGVGKDSIPRAMNFEVVDQMIQVNDKEAFKVCRQLARLEGMLVGGSSGLNLHAAIQLSKQIDSGVVVAILCDSGIKYLSKIYNDDWLRSKNLLDDEEDVVHSAPLGQLATGGQKGVNGASKYAADRGEREVASAVSAATASFINGSDAAFAHELRAARGVNGAARREAVAAGARSKDMYAMASASRGVSDSLMYWI